MLLEVSNLSVALGKSLVLQQASLDLAQGELVGLVGPNGAGKSTLFSVVSGFIRQAAGRIAFDGHDISQWSVVRRAQAGIARTFQVPREFASLTVRENLAMAMPNRAGESLWRALLNRRHVGEIERGLQQSVDDVLRLCKLEPVADLAAGSLSGGQKKLLELGRATMRTPKLLLLDEPFNGVNPVMIERLSELIKELNAMGTTVLIVEHNLQALSSIVDRIYVMDRGAMLAEGAPATVLAHESVREAYLGKAGAVHA